MTFSFAVASGFVMCSLLLGSAATVQNSPQYLLDEICKGSAAAAAERQLASRGMEDPATRELISELLPSLLLETKALTAVRLLANLAGTLQLESTVPALAKLLTDDRNKLMMMTTLRQTDELVDDPVGAALAKIGNASVPKVSDLLQSADPKTVYRAVHVLTKIGTPEALGALTRADENENNVRLRSLTRTLPPRKADSPPELRKNLPDLK